MKENNNTNEGSSMDGNSGRATKFTTVVEQIKLNAYKTHPEAEFLKRYCWEGMITIRFESARMSQDNPHASARRKDMIRALMNDIRKKWKLRKKQIRWISSTEYGSGNAHCHIIFNFFPITSSGKEAPCLANFVELAKECLDWICKVQKIDSKSIDFYWSPVTDSDGLVDYALKIESNRKFSEKEILWSIDGKVWAQEMLQFFVKAIDEEVSAA